jgi:polyribonucleotide nucleotidyltransferase
MEAKRVVCTIGGRELSIETGRMAKLADGAAWVRYGDTVVLVTTCVSKEPRDVDFLPLVVDYREKTFAAGKIPGGFFKREGRPTEKETLSSRLIDRAIRPFFPKEFRREVQILCNVFSADQENDPDILCLTGASAALAVSSIPFPELISAVRIGKKDGEYVVNPTFPNLDYSTMDVVVAGTDDSIVMVEAGADQVEEREIVEAFTFASGFIREINAAQRELQRSVGKEKFSWAEAKSSGDIEARIREASTARLRDVNEEPEKEARQRAIDAIRADVVGSLIERFPEAEPEIQRVLDDIEKELVRELILKQGRRVDGRGYGEIRPITCEVQVLPRTHGSAIFTRGQTQALVVTTLGTSMDEQRVELLEGQSWKSYMLHYNFPPSSVGEVRPVRGPGRREIGHGALAERAISPVIPHDEAFPYTIRVVSEILESNGSSSMATVCAGSLSLMDAGVPISAAVAGIAMGLVTDGTKTAILTDIQGVEDHLGDMDLKVAGTGRGITAIQMDNKIGGLSQEILVQALEQAREARLRVLEIMNETIKAPRAEISQYAPRITVIRISPDKIADVIGPGGRMIKKITEETGAQIDIDDTGVVKVAARDPESGARAVEVIRAITADPEIGRVYKGTVKRIVNFGAFVEILPGRDGLLHISELADRRVARVEDVLREGDQVLVKCIGVDGEGKIRLSRKAVLVETSGAK